MKKFIKILIAVILVASSIAMFLVIAYQPTTVPELKHLCSGTYVAYQNDPLRMEFNVTEGDTLYYQMSSNRPIQIHLFYSAEERTKFLENINSSYSQFTWIKQQNYSIPIFWSGKAWFFCVSKEQAEISITLTLEHQVTKRLYETWWDQKQN